MEKSRMMERIEKEEFVERLGKFLNLELWLVVFVLVCLGFLGALFLFLFSISFIDFIFTGTVSEGLKYWYPGLLSVFLIFFKFPKLNKIWEVILEKMTE